jgi:hypothetical protein
VKLQSGGVVYFYSATNRRSRAASWSIFAPPRTNTEFFIELVTRVYGEDRARMAAHALWAQIHGLAVLIGAGVLPWEEAHARLKFGLKIWIDGAAAS